MSEMTSLEKDTQSRNRIVTDMDTNFFVEAGAGSGKTTMLVSRMVAMVEKGVPIQKICAITFTKAAAGEFYDRFQKLLIERSNPDHVWEDKGFAGQLPEPTDKTRELCAEALKNIDLCFLGTIDSFCGMVLSEHPFEARIPSDSTIISDFDAQLFFRQQYVKICSGDYGQKLASMADNFRGCFKNAEEIFVKGESVLMNNRNVHFNYEKPSAADIDSAFRSERDELIKAVKCLLEHPEIISESNKESRNAGERLADIYTSIKRRWGSNLTDILFNLSSLSGIRVLQTGIDTYGDSLSGLFEPGKAKDRSQDIVIGKEGGLVSKLRNYIYSGAMGFFEECIPVIESAMREKGVLTFFDYLYYLRNMLRRDAEGDGRLIQHIYNRHSYFLIDEFQDTNPMQAEIFFYLSSEHPVPKWSDCRPRPGSLFIVGDPKQSIYRFRSADVPSFLKVRNLFENNGGSILSLSRNFRSTSVLCNYFNRVFSEMLPEETGDQSRFEEIPVPEAREDEFQGIYTYTAYTGSLAGVYPDKTDPLQIGKIIRRLVDNGEHLIRTGDDITPRKIRYSDIMVITYGKKKLGPIMAHLDELGIPTRVEGDVPFGTNEALFEMYKIYAAVADAGDQAALYGALTGKLIGLSADEILKFRECGGEVSLKTSLDKDGFGDKTACLVASKINELKALYHLANRLSPAALFAKIMDDYRVYRTAMAENLEVVYYTLELMRNAEKSGEIVSVKDGSGYIAGLLSGDSGQERCLSLNDDRDAVHMANLHKVKGLEAPVIILASAILFMNSSEKRIIHGDDGSEGYLFGLQKEDENGNRRGYYFETADLTDQKEAEKAAGEAEGQRLVYVAATRARNALIICDSIRASRGGETHQSAWKPLMEAGLPDFLDTVEDVTVNPPENTDVVDSAALYEEAERSCVLNDRNMEKRTYSVENPSRLHLSSKMSEEQEINPVLTPEIPDAKKETDSTKTKDPHRFPALLGTMTHKLMEMLVSTKNMTEVSDMVSEIIREYRTPLTEPYEKELEKELSDVARKMRSGGYAQTNGLPQDILGTLLSADEVYCEVPFCYCECRENDVNREDHENRENDENERILWNGIMDVVYLSGGKWHIVDYKTNADGSDLDRKYKAQLGAYIRAFKATTGEDADAMTYHIDI